MNTDGTRGLRWCHVSSLACVHCALRGVQFVSLCPSEAVFRGSPGMCTAPRGWLSWCPSCMWRGQPGVRFPQMGEVGQRHPHCPEHAPSQARNVHCHHDNISEDLGTDFQVICLLEVSHMERAGGQADRCCTLAQNQSGHPGQARGTWHIRQCCPERLHSPGPSFGSGTAGHPDLGWRNLQSSPSRGREPRCENKVRIQFSSRDPCTDGGGSPRHPRGQHPRGQVPAVGVTGALTLCCS